MHRSGLGLGLGLVLLGTLAATACTVASTSSPADGGAADGSSPEGASPDGATPDSGGGDSATAGVLGFTPSNVDLSGIDVSTLGDFVVDNDACTIDTDNNLASCGDGANVLAFKTATQADGTKVAVYAAKSMTINAGKNLTVTGSLPFVFIALDTITITGTLNANAKSDVTVAGGQEVKTNRVKGAGAGKSVV